MSTLANSLASGDVSLNTNSSATSGGITPVFGRGDVVFSGTLTYSNAAARTLTITSHEDIWINGDITSDGGALNLNFNLPAGKKILINGNISTNGGFIKVNDGAATVSSVHFQKTTGTPVEQVINTNGGAINFNNSTLKLLNTGGKLVLNSGAGALTLGGSGSVVQESNFFHSPTQKLTWGGQQAYGEKNYSFSITNGYTYAMRAYFWDSWDNETGQVAVSSGGSWYYYFHAYRTFSSSSNGFSSVVNNYGTQYQLSSQGSLGGNSTWVDAYADINFTAQHTGALKTWTNLNSAVDDESLELYNVWETSYTTTSYNSGARTVEFSTTNTTNDACLISGQISGALAVKKLGSGTLKFNNYHEYTGGTIVDAGILQLHDPAVNGNIGRGVITNSLTVNQNGTVQLSAAAGGSAAFGWWPNNRVTTLNINGGLVEVVGGQQHIWDMTGGVNFSGGGTIRTNSGSSSASTSSYIEWGGSNVTVSNASATSPAVIAGRVNLRNDLGAITFTVNNSSQENDLIISAAITQASATNLTKAGTGKLALTGDNTYAGTTTINAGTLVAGSASALGTGNVILAAGTTLLTGRAVATLANNIVLNGNATLGLDKSVEVLLVGGGGGGASGGGGAGGVVSQTMALNSGAYIVAVGAGGTGGVASNVGTNGTNGSASVFNSVTAAGGGGGGRAMTGGLSGASGGGTGSDVTTAGGAATQGYAGGAGISTAPCSGASGGGGAGAAGSPGWTQTDYNNFYSLSGQNTMGGNAGIGVINSITGTATYYGGGGGGGCNNNAATAQPVERAGQGGAGGGGRGANANNGNGVAGTANTGGGGGGGDWEGSGAAGGSGVVIIRYAGAANGTGGTIASGTGSATGYTIHTFTAVGNSTLTLNASNLNLTGVISGTGGLTYEANDGSITLSAANTYSGNTIISSGSLILNTNNTFGSTSFSSTFTNNGTFTLKNGATFIPSPVANSISGTGTYNVEKALTGNAATWTTANTSRFWYMGVPMVGVARSSFGNYDLNTNRLWSYSESTKTYTNITDNNATLAAGTGYVHRRSTDGTLTFSASGTNGLRATDYSTGTLTRTSGSSVGFNLISNPYMAYLDWHAVTKTNVESTYYIRSNNAGNDISALITYNGSNQQLTNNSSLTLTAAQMQYIAPMQAIWVRVGSTTTTGSLSMTRNMLSHQSGNPGLKSSTIFPTLARVNLVDGARFDQMLVFMNQDMVNGVDEYDSEKMFVSGAPQLYTMAAGKKLVMNGLNSNKKKISVPVYLELPESKVYQLQLADYNLEDGLILLEDKQEGTIQDFTIHDTYAFYANSGVLQNRFVLHFYMPDATITTQGPSNNWVAEEGSYTEGGNIVISSDPKGKVTVALELPEDQKVEGMVQVTDANGKVVYNGQLEGLTTEFELNVPSGIYYLTVQSGNILENKKVFIQE